MISDSNGRRQHRALWTSCVFKKVVWWTFWHPEAGPNVAVGSKVNFKTSCERLYRFTRAEAAWPAQNANSIFQESVKIRAHIRSIASDVRRSICSAPTASGLPCPRMSLLLRIWWLDSRESQTKSLYIYREAVWPMRFAF